MAVADVIRQDTIPVTNPVTGEVIGEIPRTPADAVREAVTRARAAQPAWASRDIKARIKDLQRWSDLVWEHQEEIIALIRRETGKPHLTAFVEPFATDNTVHYYAKNAPKLLRPQTRRSFLPFIHKARVHYKPHGVVGIISPWNFPFNLPFMDAIPALIAGNAVIFKPSEVTPYSVEYGVELMHRAGIPADVVQVVQGDGATGAALVDHVDYIGFTGSTATGLKVAQRAVERFIPYSLELGGKDPAIVLNDADVEHAAADMVRGAFDNNGQFCMSVERVYAEAGIYDDLVARIADYAGQYTVGTHDSAHTGSFTNERELLRAEAHIKDAVEKGATVLHGGNRLPELGPLFFEPTVLVNVDHSMDVMQEETFGPILPVMKVNDAEEAVRLANDSSYGLASSVYTGDLKRGEELAVRINSGDTSVNTVQFVVATPALPSGGVKESGVGRRNGPEGILRYVSTKSVVVNNGIGQKPSLVALDDNVLKLLNLVRRARKVLPFL